MIVDEVPSSCSGALVQLGSQVELVEVDGIEDGVQGVDEVGFLDLLHYIHVDLSSLRLLHSLHLILLLLEVLLSEVQELRSENSVDELLDERVLFEEKREEETLEASALSDLQETLFSLLFSLQFHYGGLALSNRSILRLDLRVSGWFQRYLDFLVLSREKFLELLEYHFLCDFLSESLQVQKIQRFVFLFLSLLSNSLLLALVFLNLEFLGVAAELHFIGFLNDCVDVRSLVKVKNGLGNVVLVDDIHFDELRS